MINKVSDSYKSISKAAEGLFKDKGSKFLAFAYPINNEDEAKLIVANLRKEYHDARHHCYAYRINPENPIYRVNDDGEPSGTAGKPIYGQILSNDLFDIIVVVVRYFGGTLLGTSGLINAYRAATSDCIINSVIIEKIIETSFEISFPYEQMNQVMKIIKEENINTKKQDFNLDCFMVLSARKSILNKVIDRFEKIEQLKLNYL